MRMNYEKLITNLNPKARLETEISIITTWVFDTFYVEHITDKGTGEIQWKKKRRRDVKSPNLRRKADHYSMIFDDIGQARKNRTLTFHEVALLHALIECIEWEDNYVYNEQGDRMSIKQFAAYIKRDEHWVHKILRSLENKEFIRLEISKHGSSVFVECRYAWRGRIEEKTVSFKDNAMNAV